MIERYEHIEIPDRDEPKNPGRRAFLKKTAKIGAGLAIAGTALPKIVEKISEEEDPSENIPEEIPTLDGEKKTQVDHERKEGVLEVKTPLEQMKVYGEIRDLKQGVTNIYTDHLRHLVSTDKGREDMRRATKNIAQLNMKKIVRLYKERGLSEKYAYMIAIQETRGRNMVSHAGARGYTGLMPKTIQALGYKKEDAKDPVKANEMTAKYLAIERDDRFGEDEVLLNSAYNAGGGLFGYTNTVKSKEERSAEDFYEYMQEYINTRFEKIKKTVIEDGYYEYTLKKNDKTLTHVSKRLGVDLQHLLEINNFTDHTIIKKGQKIRIPCSDPVVAAKVLLHKPFEAINYSPEINAKYKALSDLGYRHKIELAMKTR